MAAAYGINPFDASFTMLSDEQLCFMRDSKRNYMHEMFDALSTILGTRMTSEEFWGNSDAPKQSTKKAVVAFPLSMLLAPEAASKAYSTHLEKPSKKSGNGSEGAPIELGDIFDAKSLKDIFANIKDEAKQTLQDIGSQPKA